jgi:integrase
MRDGLYQRGERWFFKYKNGDGKWIARATGKSLYSEAKKERTRFFQELEQNGMPAERIRWKLQAAVDQHLGDRKLRIKPGSYASEVCICKSLVNVLGADSKLESLADISVVRKYENTRLASGAKSKSVNNAVLVLASILRQAKLWRRIADDYKPLKVDKSDVPDALTAEESQRLIQSARMANENAVAPFAAVLSFATGMRSKEIKHLKLGAIHIEGDSPYIQVSRASTKSNAGARAVALDSMAVWALRKLLARAEKLGANHPDHYLLPTLLERHTRQSDPLHGKGEGHDPNCPMNSWDAEWDAFRKIAKLEHRRFHDLRHSYITRAAVAGISFAILQSQVGHVSKQITENYVHISKKEIHKAALQIEAQSTELMQYLV